MKDIYINIGTCVLQNPDYTINGFVHFINNDIHYHQFMSRIIYNKLFIDKEIKNNKSYIIIFEFNTVTLEIDVEILYHNTIQNYIHLYDNNKIYTLWNDFISLFIHECSMAPIIEYDLTPQFNIGTKNELISYIDLLKSKITIKNITFIESYINFDIIKQ